MSEKKSFKSLLSNFQDGLKKINEESKRDAEQDLRSEKADDLTNDNSTGQDAHADEMHEEIVADKFQTEPDLGDAEDGLIIEAEQQPAKPKSGLAALSAKQKILGLVVIGAVAIGAQKMLSNPASSLPPALPEEQANFDSDFDAFTGDTFAGNDDAFNGDSDFGGGSAVLDFEFADDPIAQESTAPAELNLEGPNNDLTIGLAESEADEFAFLDQNQVFLDPFTTQVTEEAPTSDLFIFDETEVSTLDDQPAADAALAQIAPSESNAHEFGGTVSANLDSGSNQLLIQAEAEIEKLKAELGDSSSKNVELEGKLKGMEKELEKLKGELAEAKKARPAVATRPAAPKPARVARPAAKPAVPARPQLCVAAVAQAARNCTTCVPHAFVTHNGNETMLGHGDFIESLRVNIVGDRLDLQNSEGEVVHKFWSSPNGCTS